MGHSLCLGRLSPRAPDLAQPPRSGVGACYGLIREERHRRAISEPRLESERCPRDYYGVDYYENHGKTDNCKYEVHSGAKVLRAAAAPADRRLPASRGLSLDRRFSDDPCPAVARFPAVGGKGNCRGNVLSDPTAVALYRRDRGVLVFSGARETRPRDASPDAPP